MNTNNRYTHNHIIYINDICGKPCNENVRYRVFHEHWWCTPRLSFMFGQDLIEVICIMLICTGSCRDMWWPVCVMAPPAAHPTYLTVLQAVTFPSSSSSGHSPANTHNNLPSLETGSYIKNSLVFLIEIYQCSIDIGSVMNNAQVLHFQDAASSLLNTSGFSMYDINQLRIQNKQLRLDLQAEQGECQRPTLLHLSAF